MQTDCLFVLFLFYLLEVILVYISRIHQENPQQRLIEQAVSVIREGGLVVLPTDCAYVFACNIHDKSAMDRLRQIRNIDEKHLLTLICHDLANIGLYARVDNAQYRFLKSATPGPYTFILDASKELPRRIMSPKRKTIGVRIPDHLMLLTLLQAIDEPLLSSSLILPGQTEPMTDAEEIAETLGNRVDLIVESGVPATYVTTVLDLTTTEYQLIRQGAGDIEPLGLSN